MRKTYVDNSLEKAYKLCQMSVEDPIENFCELAEKDYPGRIVIVTLSPSGDRWRLFSMIAGRSESSRNRKYIHDEASHYKGAIYKGVIKTMPADPNKPYGDPEKTIYVAQASIPNSGLHVVSNGYQTELLIGVMHYYRHRGFEDAQEALKTEGKDSDYTSRISAAVWDRSRAITFGRVVRNPLDETLSDPHVYTTRAIPHCGAYVSTYIGDGTTTPQRGDPVAIWLPGDTLEENVEELATRVDQKNLVGVAGKEVDFNTGEITKLKIWNKNK